MSDKEAERVVIPDTYNSLPVKEVDFTFEDFTKLKEIVIGNFVEKTVFGTFDCLSLEKIYFGKSINTISGPFDNCVNLTDIYYYGTEEDWENINFVALDDSFENVTKADFHFGILGESAILTFEDKHIFPYTHWDCINGKPEKIDGKKIFYDNSVSGLKADNIKEAVDELNAKSFDASCLESWDELKHLVRSGRASEFIKIGDRFTCNRNGKELTWIVIGIDTDKPADKNLKHSLTLQLDECISNIPFTVPEAGCFLFTPLIPGNYYVGLTNYADTPDYYGLTVEEEIKEDCLLRFSEGKVYVYNKDRTTIISTLDITSSSKNKSDMTGKEITPANYRIHNNMGNLDYSKSDIRQWLNSDKSGWWESKSLCSLVPKDYLSVPGFMNGVDEDFLNAVNPVVKVTVLPDGKTVETADKFFLISSEEIYAEGTNHYPYFKENSSLSKPDYAVDAIRIKNFSDAPRHWWLRNSASGDNGYMRVLTDGGVGAVISTKILAFGVVPACSIC